MERAVDLASLRSHFNTSPAIRLLRADLAPYIVDFLNREFLRPGRVGVPTDELHDALAAYRDDVRETDPDALCDAPAAYLSDWYSGEKRWLRRTLEGSNDAATYQLTPHAQEVLTYLDRALNSDLGFIGTESRLRLVIESLHKLVVESSADPNERLSHLRAEKARVEAEIEQIERGGPVARLPAAHIRERFDVAVVLLKGLLGDFRAVEERFKELARQVYGRQTAGGDTRGGILRFALDAEDALMRDDQGVSFSAFVRLVFDPVQTERLSHTVRALTHLPELAGQAAGLETVGRMLPLLLTEAEQVMRTEQRLSAALRRLLAPGNGHDGLHVGRACADVLALAVTLADDPPLDVGAEVEADLAISSPFARPFWVEPPRFAHADLVERPGDTWACAAALRQLAQLPRLNWPALEARIDDALAHGGVITLKTLLDAHPPAAGVIEVLAYLQLAHDGGSHDIDTAETESLIITGTDGRDRTLTVPYIRFVSQ